MIKITEGGNTIEIMVSGVVKRIDVSDLYSSLEVKDARIPELDNYTKEDYLENSFICPGCYTTEGGDVTNVEEVEDSLEVTITCHICKTSVVDIFKLKDVLNIGRNSNMKKKPEKITNDHLNFLDKLRESTTINMFGAVPYLMIEYPELTKDEAKSIHSYWMLTFGNENR